MSDTWNRCSYCGQFIAYRRFESGDAFIVEERTMDVYGNVDEREIVTCPRCVFPPREYKPKEPAHG